MVYLCKKQPFEFAGELANWFVNWFGELAVRSVSEFALDGIPLVRCIGSVVRPWVPEPSNLFVNSSIFFSPPPLPGCLLEA